MEPIAHVKTENVQIAEESTTNDFVDYDESSNDDWLFDGAKGFRLENKKSNF